MPPSEDNAQISPVQYSELNDSGVNQNVTTRGASSAGTGTHSKHLSDVPDRSLGNEKISYDVLKYVPEESAEHYKIAPIGLKDGVLEIGVVDPDDLSAVDALNFITRRTGTPFKIFHISEDDFHKVLGMYRGLGGSVDQALTDLQTEDSSVKSEQKITGEETLDLDDPEIISSDGAAGASIQEDAPAIKLVSTILRYAIDGGASDVHIEPSESGVRIRYRVDGILHTSVVLPKQTHRAIVARIKVLSSIRLDEKRKPQDGRFSASIEGRKVDFRVSTFPAYSGEKVVIRILDRDFGYIPLDQLGMTERDSKLLREAIKKPYGLILISGPTGSGKSTTLYSMLTELDREEKNVLSLEDPIEYYVDGVNQSQVFPEIGYTFATGLRTTLRQDPDIIMVGEIRDGDTAKLAVQAALTGHLVLSTIHTNSAVGTIPRLIDMGVEPYLLPPTLIISVAQRLVRKLCDGGGKEYEVTDSMHGMMDDQFKTLPEKFRPKLPKVVYEAERTPSCPNGTRGRLAVFEVLEMSPEIERKILKSPIESEIWAEARKQGMYTMKEDAMIKAFDKKIPFSEVNLLSGLLLEEEKPITVKKVIEIEKGNAEI
jgi:type IV pilus assembly protein PilB